MSLGKWVQREIKLEVTKQVNERVSLFVREQQGASLTGKAEVTKMNSDGTVNVKIDGQEVKNVSPGSRPVGVGSPVILAAGAKLV